MTILILIDNYYPNTGSGVTQAVMTEVDKLLERGHKIVVLTRRTDPKWSMYESYQGYDIYRYRVPPKKSPLFILNPLYSIRRLPDLVQCLHNEYNFDVVFAHNPYQAATLSQIDIPLIYDFHFPMSKDIAIEAKYGKFKKVKPILGAIQKMVQKIEYQALSNANQVITHSRFMHDELHYVHNNMGLLNCGVDIIPLAVDTSRFQFMQDPRKARELFEVSVDSPLLLSVRRLVGRMGLQNLIDAMKKVLKYCPDVMLLIGGKGYLQQKLQNQIQENHLAENVKLIGFIPDEELPTYYQAADLFVMPTAELEGFGLTTIEALSCGTPVVVTPVGANTEVIGGLDKRLLCKNFTPEAIADRIIYWLNENSLLQLRERCRQYCEANFSQEVVVPRLEKIFTNAIESYC